MMLKIKLIWEESIVAANELEIESSYVTTGIIQGLIYRVDINQSEIDENKCFFQNIIEKAIAIDAKCQKSAFKI